jgi:hypothetical protein
MSSRPMCGFLNCTSRRGLEGDMRTESHEMQLHVFLSVKAGDDMKRDPIAFRVLSNSTI